MSKTYSNMHSITAQYYDKWEKRLGVPVVVLGAATASSIFTTDSTIGQAWTYINGFLVLLMTGISGVSKFIGAPEKKAKHTSAAYRYTKIAMNIDTMLSFPRRNREGTPREFISGIKTSILDIRKHTPDLPTWVVADFIANVDKSLVNTRTMVNRHRGDANDTPSDHTPSSTTAVMFNDVANTPGSTPKSRQAVPRRTRIHRDAKVAMANLKTLPCPPLYHAPTVDLSDIESQQYAAAQASDLCVVKGCEQLTNALTALDDGGSSSESDA